MVDHLECPDITKTPLELTFAICYYTSFSGCPGSFLHSRKNSGGYGSRNLSAISSIFSVCCMLPAMPIFVPLPIARSTAPHAAKVRVAFVNYLMAGTQG
jgi:hypothetical protein